MPTSLKPPAGAALKLFLTVTVTGPLHMLLTEPIDDFLSLYTALAFAIVYSFFAAFPLVYFQIYNFTIAQSGLVFVAIGIGYILALITMILLDIHASSSRRVVPASRGKQTTPAQRLYLALLASFALPIGLFWFAWSAKESVHWICPVLACVPIAWANILLFTPVAMYLMDIYDTLDMC
ncbi:hypothetical protein H2203_005963 [Taxawa tesnikishii (nom. ined.)]|nr:hypothetical protein H2203_005963 [Dothideales sp. JES 119]